MGLYPPQNSCWDVPAQPLVLVALGDAVVSTAPKREKGESLKKDLAATNSRERFPEAKSSYALPDSLE